LCVVGGGGFVVGEGSRASLAGKTLKEIGFSDVQNLEGGFRGWKEFSS
jgi:rhodanese-related sulfurtransferase